MISKDKNIVQKRPNTHRIKTKWINKNTRGQFFAGTGNNGSYFYFARYNNLLKAILSLIKSNWAYLAFLIFVSAIFWKLYYPPGFRAATDFHYSYPQERLANLILPQTWNNNYTQGLGYFRGSVMWTWPLEFLTSIFFLALGEQLTLYLFLVLVPITTTYIAFAKLVGNGKSQLPVVAATVFYILNSYFILLLDGGQFGLVVAYGWMPLAFVLVMEALALAPRKIILSALSVVILSFLDIRIVYLLFILLGIYVIFDIKKMKNYLLVGIWITLMVIPCHVFWLLPSVFSRLPSLPATYTRVSQTDFLNFVQLKHALFLVQPHWYKNIFGQIPIFNKEFIFIPVLIIGLVLLSLIKTRKREALFCWLLVLGIGIFLAKGSNPPLGSIYTWLFTNVPGFVLFRDSSKFFFIVALAYSMLLLMSLSLLRNTKTQTIIVILILAWTVFVSRPVWLGKMTGLLSLPENENVFAAAAQSIDTSSFGRLLWVATKSPLGYSSATNPSVNANTLAETRPFQIGSVGTYEYLNFLREAPFAGELFDIAGVRYIFYPYPDARSETLKQDNIDYYYNFLDQLTNLAWIEGRVQDPPVAILKTKKTSDHVFLADNLFYLVGSDRIYNELTEFAGFELRKNAFVFAEEYAANSQNILNNSNAKIILYDKDVFDLITSFIPMEYFVFPASGLGFDPDSSGWWKRETSDFLSWRVFLQEKYGVDYQEFDYGGGMAVGEGSRKLTIKSDRFHKGDLLFVRVLGSVKGGSVSVNGGSQIPTNSVCDSKIKVTLSGYKEVASKEFEYDCSKYFWINAGALPNDGKVDISVDGEINVINAIVSVPLRVVDNISTEVQKKEIIYWNKLSQNEKQNLFVLDSSDKTQVEFKRISPTEYKLKVHDMVNPKVLVFSESYDPSWTINGKDGFQVYSLINGFYIDKNGEYKIYFEPQKYVVPGLLITLASMGLVLILYVVSRNRS